MTDQEMTTTVRIGETELQMNGPHLGSFRDANQLVDDPKALRERMTHDGYLLIRSLQKKEAVLQARRTILEHLRDQGALDPDSPLMQGRIAPDRGPAGGYAGDFYQRSLQSSHSIVNLARSKEIMGFFERFLGGPVRTFDHKWMRIKGTGASGGAHYDVVYMGQGTKNLYSVWCPLGDVSLELGGLAVCVGSHRWERVKETYGKMDVDRDRIGDGSDGLFSHDPLELVAKFGGHWKTTTYNAGDVLVFSMFTMHAGLGNQTDRFRLSMDTRYQLASDPVDKRWIGENFPGYSSTFGKRGMKPMKVAREEWGV